MSDHLHIIGIVCDDLFGRDWGICQETMGLFFSRACAIFLLPIGILKDYFHSIGDGCYDLFGRDWGICQETMGLFGILRTIALPEPFLVFRPLIDVLPPIPFLFFLLAFFWQASIGFR